MRILHFFLIFLGHCLSFQMEISLWSYTLPKTTHKVLPIPSESFQKFWPRKKSGQIKNPENLSIFGQIDRVTRLEFPIKATNTIFRNLKSMRVQWANSFSNLRTSKIWVCKGPPFEISICFQYAKYRSNWALWPHQFEFHPPNSQNTCNYWPKKHIPPNPYININSTIIKH